MSMATPAGGQMVGMASGGLAQRAASVGAGAPSAAPSAFGAIDPIKLLNRYKWIFAAAAVLGVCLGVAAHLVLRKVYPQWRPAAMFQCLPAVRNASDVAPATNDQEMIRFMATQTRQMTLDSILKRTVEDPQFLAQAPKWSAYYMAIDPNTGQEAFDSEEAAKDLKDYVVARMVPQTNIIELSMTGTDKWETTAILALVRAKYMQSLLELGRAQFDERQQTLRQSLTRINEEVVALASRRESIVQSQRVDSINDQMASVRFQLQTVNERLVEVTQDLDGARARSSIMQEELNSPAGVTYGDELKSQVEREPLILELKAEISRIENQQQMRLNMGISRDHREFQQLEAQLVGARSNLDETRRDLLRKAFDADLDQMRRGIAQLEAQQRTLDQNATEMRARLTDLTRVQGQIADIERQIDGLQFSRADIGKQLQEIQSLSTIAAANRVIMIQAERPPPEMSFPQWKLMIPAGLVSVLGLVVGIVFLRELVDQRVKGPADIAILPRTRLLGWIPDAAEDPAGAGASETAFRDRSKGVVAESFRQVRGTLLKRIQAGDQRTVLVMGGLPGSGSTTVAANLALALAGADRRVLIIDANFRRPAMHRVFGVQESPGLADGLAKVRPVEESIQATSTPNLDLLTAGSKEHRLFERLSTLAMAELLASLKARYDVVLIDVAPAIVANDGMALAQKCDATILVVRALSEKRGMVNRIKNELQDARSEFLGVVVNAVRSSAGGYIKGNMKTSQEYQEAA
jgi:capsular exopolysaccharide synthesis family protein